MKKPVDYYRIGCLYDYVYKSPQIASDYYKKAVSQINIERPTKADQFILRKLADRVELDLFLEIDETPIRPHLQKTDVPILETKVDIDEKIVWESDNNNVHDTEINNEVANKINRICGRVGQPMPFEEAVSVVLATKMPKFEESGKDMAAKTLNHIRQYNQMLMKTNTCEKDLLGYVVADINQNYSQDRRQVLLENLVNNLKDASSESGVVCINGRISRILNAYTDGEEENFKTVQVWRNELFENARRAKDQVLDSLSEEQRKIYNNDTAGDELKKINDEIGSQMRASVAISGAPPKVISEVMDELQHCI